MADAYTVESLLQQIVFLAGPLLVALLAGVSGPAAALACSAGLVLAGNLWFTAAASGLARPPCPAVNPAAGRPGLVIIPTEDGYTGGEERARWSAGQAKAEVTVLPELGHWWMIQDPAAGAAALRKFWNSL